MATKNCPHCQKQVPVASKSCHCGHVFFATRRSANSMSKDLSIVDTEVETIKTAGLKEPEIIDLPRRRTGRVKEKPDFYDASQYDTVRKQKMILRRQTKPKDDPTKDVKEIEVKKRRPSSEDEPKKKRRGRPPGLNSGRKPVTTPRLQIGVGGRRPNLNPAEVKLEGEEEEEEEDIMNNILPAKALQYNVCLGEINRKWATANWRPGVL